VKIKQISLLLFFLLSNLSLLFSQNNNQIPEQKKGRFYTIEGYEVKFKSLREDGNNLIYKNSKGKILTIEKNDVLRIDAQNGNEALRWGSISLGTGLIGAGIGAIAITRTQEIDGRTVNKKQRNAFVIGYTAFFTTVGTLMGISKKKYKTVFDNPTYSSRSKNWNFKATSIHNKPALGLTFRF